MQRWTVEPVLWAVVYPVNPNDPIGWVRYDSGGYWATLDSEDLGAYPTGDRAVEAVWSRYLERARLEHEVASRTHGSAERHQM